MFLLHNNVPWSELTNSPIKKTIFSTDFYFELSYEIAKQVLKADIPSFLKNYTFLLIKPEAFITRKINVLIKELKNYNFELVHFSIKFITHTQISELWKYMWSGASLIRIIVNQEYYSKYKCGFLILRNIHYTGQDLCAYLADIKGKALKGKYKDPDIRYRMNSINTFLNHIHSPDEIADFMREIAVFFEWEELTIIYQKILNNEIADYFELENAVIEYPFTSNAISPELILTSLIQNVQNKMQVSIQENQKNNLFRIYEELLSINRAKKKFTYRLLEEMRKENILLWNWPMFILLTTYMEYFNGHQTIL